jgi:uncharacterized glyoxalase superfamily protein PhnB
MKNRTITVTVAADRDVVFAFLSRLENLPTWAPAVCSDLRRESGLWRAATMAGEMVFESVSDVRSGVVDLLVGSKPDEMALLPIRIVTRPHGSAVTCTLFQPADWADELYEMYYDALLHGMRGLVSRFGGGELTAATSRGEPFYPNLVTSKFYETWDFYTAFLGFRTVAESDSYVHLVHAGGAQIGVLRHELNGDAPELVTATDGRGFWLNLDVADADAEYARLLAAGAVIASPIADKPWGDRQFTIRDPNGVLVAIAHRTPTCATESMPLAAN